VGSMRKLWKPPPWKRAGEPGWKMRSQASPLVATKSAAACGGETLSKGAVTETYGEVSPNLLIEAVVDPEHPNHLCLQPWNGRRSTAAPQVSYQGQTYVAGPLMPVSRKRFGFHPVVGRSDPLQVWFH